jgi:hypothetical protein
MEHSQENFEKNITSYLEGSLNSKDKSEFEAFIALNPQFRQKIELKANEIEKLKQKIPSIVMSQRTRELLEDEMKQSVCFLLQSESRTLWQKIKDYFEEKSIR